MCAVSFVSDTYMQRFPLPGLMPSRTMDEYLELVRKAAEYDRMTGQPDCPKPEAETFREQVQRLVDERLRQLGAMPPG